MYKGINTYSYKTDFCVLAFCCFEVQIVKPSIFLDRRWFSFSYTIEKFATMQIKVGSYQCKLLAKKSRWYFQIKGKSKANLIALSEKEDTSRKPTLSRYRRRNPKGWQFQMHLEKSKHIMGMTRQCKPSSFDKSAEAAKVQIKS